MAFTGKFLYRAHHFIMLKTFPGPGYLRSEDGVV